MTFWLIIAAAALAIVAAFAYTMARARSESTEAALYDIKVYRDQLAEIDRDEERGTLDAEEAERARTEISRRLLAADKAAKAATQAETAPKGATYGAIIASALVLTVGSYYAYTFGGANRPGQPLYPDMPLAERIAAADELRASRPSQAEFEADLPPWAGPAPDVPADYIELITKLRAAVAENPDDLEGNQLLALHEARLGNYVAAHQAMAKVIALKGEAASADDYAQYADLLIMSADGYVSPEAEAALQETLRRRPDDPVARYYSGLMFAQIGRPDRAFRLWRDLIEQYPDNEALAAPIRAQIGQLAAAAGVDYTPPAAPGMRGPDADAIAAAASMSEADRTAMVEGMVGQLMDRLASQGGSSQEWAQLISALAVLGRTDQAAAIWQEAQGVFADQPDDLARVNQAAARANLQAAPATSPQSDPDEAERLRALDNQVSALSDRLFSEGGPASDWARLIDLLGQMNELAKAKSVWGAAQEAFAETPDQLEIIRQSAERIGVAE